MGSRLFDEIREQRGLAYSVYAVDHSFADVPILQLSAGLESAKCVEAYTRMREIVDELRTDGPTEEEFERARAYAAGRRVLAFENTNAVARHAAVADRRLRPGHRPRRGDRRARRGHVRRGRRDRRAGISEELSVACVGPHETGDFDRYAQPLGERVELARRHPLEVDAEGLPRRLGGALRSARSCRRPRRARRRPRRRRGR